MSCVARVLDVRGLRCPLVLVRARQALARLPAGEALVVLATDPEAPIDLAALAADTGLAFAQEREGEAWRLVLGRSSGGGRRAL
jgi:tRNA 2-thiouridine synthesizing protein A